MVVDATEPPVGHSERIKHGGIVQVTEEICRGFVGYLGIIVEYIVESIYRVFQSTSLTVEQSGSDKYTVRFQVSYQGADVLLRRGVIPVDRNSRVDGHDRLVAQQ